MRIICLCPGVGVKAPHDYNAVFHSKGIAVFIVTEGSNGKDMQGVTKGAVKSIILILSYVLPRFCIIMKAVLFIGVGLVPESSVGRRYGCVDCKIVR